MKKRVLTIFLLLCVLVTMAPAVFASEDISVTITADEARHGSAVKRYLVGDIYVVLNGNGGEVTGKFTQSQLPTAVRDGYAFMGWYDYNGVEYTAEDALRSSVNLVLSAMWLPDGATHQVLFDANGGELDAADKSVINGGTYGELPVPSRDGYEFAGWYTDRTDGERITSDTAVELAGDVSLYAHWEPVRDGDLTFDIITYSFSNSSKAFGYPSGYKIPLERYIYMYGDTARARVLYESAGAWGGNCFGLSSTAGMFIQEDNAVDITAFNGGAEVLYDLNPSDSDDDAGLTLREFVEAMQIGWYSETVQSSASKNKDRLAELVSDVTSSKNTGQNTVVISMYGYTPEGNMIGHAVVGYDIIEVSDTESRILVYDCNFPNDSSRYITVTTDYDGAPVGWYYSMNDKYDMGSDYSGSWFTYVPYASYYEAWMSTQDEDMNVLNVTSDNVNIKDSNGNIVATVRDGQLETDRDDIYQTRDLGITADGDIVDNTGATIWLPSLDCYTVENADDGEFTATMTNVDQSITVTTTAGDVSLAVNDWTLVNYVSVDTPSAEYEVSLMSTLEGALKEINFSGSTEETLMSFAKVAGELYAIGVEAGVIPELKLENIFSYSELPMVVSKVLDYLLGAPETVAADGETYNDVSAEAWYYDEVTYVSERGLMNGTGDGNFSPDSAATRASVVTILYRLAGEPGPGGGGSFDDVANGMWYTDAITWAHDNGIVTGYSGSAFMPDGEITREQLATILYRYADRYAGMDVSAGADLSGYTDCGQIHDYAVDAMSWANAMGLITGTGNSTLSPRDTCTRAQLAAVLSRIDGIG